MIRTSTDDGVRIIVFANPPLNALSPEITGGLAAAMDDAANDTAVRAVVLSGDGQHFTSGADIRWFGKPLPPGVPNLRDVIDRIERSEKPYVAAIDGLALGGGLEIALACDARIATGRSNVGLPEIHLGLLPGAGGTQRLTRLAGVATALDVILSGTQVPADRALRLGILDAVVDADAVGAASAAVRNAATTGRTRASERTPAADAERIAAARADAPAAERGGLAARACIDAIEGATQRTFSDGLAYERELFTALLASEQAKSRIHLFFAEREAGKVHDLPADAVALPVARACVVGAGTMGTGIAVALANGGIAVDIVEQDAAALQRARGAIEAIYAAGVRKGRATAEDAARRQTLLSFGTDLGVAGAADVTIEAVFEELELKRVVFETLDGICRPGSILASNTSTLDIDAIASATSRPQDVIGLHFFSPANVMRLLEIVRGTKTSATAVVTALALAKRMRKIGVVARTCDGFIANRMLIPYIRAANALVLEGALPHDVDGALIAFGFALGPFAMMDLAGLDVGYDAVADELYARGRFGQKTGAGYYRYMADGRKPLPDPLVEELIVAESARRGIVRRAIDPTEIVERCVGAAVAEGDAVLADGTAQRASDIDVVWVLGFGFPAYRGGPMHYARTPGPEPARR